MSDIVLVDRLAPAQSSFAPLLQISVEDLTDEQKLEVWSFLDGFVKKVGERTDALRAYLLEFAKENGEADDKGSCTVSLAGGTIQRQARNKVEVDADLVQVMLEKKKIPLDHGGTTSWKPDNKKLEKLVAQGRISAEELSACATVKTTFALVVTKPERIKKLLGE